MLVENQKLAEFAALVSSGDVRPGPLKDRSKSASTWERRISSWP